MMSLRQSVLGLLTAAAFATVPVAAQDTGIAVGATAPDAAVHALDGRAVNLATYLGKGPVVLEFWATWCPLCKQLEPALTAAKATHGHRVTFIGITVPQNQTPARARAFIEKHELPGVYLFDTDGAASRAYAVPHTSYLVVINAAGKVVYTGVGGTQDVEAALARLGPEGGRSMMDGREE
ncbi:MAG: TlpA family protein disulfide reductase [Gemmatimonadetes bacterium]|nr:TlpA family protein disulfide reductase [Gemmatimonadota bacterium]MCA9768287.1 TlpA family protein disulfide reductase [Gemmatimonadota bacterium]